MGNKWNCVQLHHQRKVRRNADNPRAREYYKKIIKQRITLSIISECRLLYHLSTSLFETLVCHSLMSKITSCQVRWLSIVADYEWHYFQINGSTLRHNKLEENDTILQHESTSPLKRTHQTFMEVPPSGQHFQRKFSSPINNKTSQIYSFYVTSKMKMIRRGLM